MVVDFGYLVLMLEGLFVCLGEMNVWQLVFNMIFGYLYKCLFNEVMIWFGFGIQLCMLFEFFDGEFEFIYWDEGLDYWLCFMLVLCVLFDEVLQMVGWIVVRVGIS